MKTIFGFTPHHFLPAKSGAGFTLIETLIYIACLSFLMASLVCITYQTIFGLEQINKKIVLQQEANFILQKMDWALTDASSLPVAAGSSIVINRFAPPLSVSFTQNGSYLDVDSGSGQLHLNSQNTIIFNVVFLKTQNPQESVEVQVRFSLADAGDPSNAESFQLTKYLR